MRIKIQEIDDGVVYFTRDAVDYKCYHDVLGITVLEVMPQPPAVPAESSTQSESSSSNDSENTVSTVVDESPVVLELGAEAVLPVVTEEVSPEVSVAEPTLSLEAGAATVAAEPFVALETTSAQPLVDTVFAEETLFPAIASWVTLLDKELQEKQIESGSEKELFVSVHPLAGKYRVVVQPAVYLGEGFKAMSFEVTEQGFVPGSILVSFDGLQSQPDTQLLYEGVKKFGGMDSDQDVLTSISQIQALHQTETGDIKFVLDGLDYRICRDLLGNVVLVKEFF